MKLLESKKIYKIVLSIMLMLALILGCIGAKNAAELDTDIKSVSNNIGVTYRAHAQDIGWQNWKIDGEFAGTEGKSLRLEAINVKLSEKSQFKIKYKTHIQDIGWQDWKYDGELSGTEGKSLRLEAIKIELENTEDYSVMYRVHVQDIGWQDWKYDGELSGTEGKSLRLEAIEIKIVKKKAKSLLNIDTNLNDAIFDKNGINIEGWKLSTEPNTKLEVYMNNKQIDEKYIKYSYKYNLTSIVKGYGTAEENPTPNFDINIPTLDLDNEFYRLEIRFVTSKGEILDSVKKDIIVDKSTKAILNVDTELNDIFDYEKMHIEGWKLATEPGTKLTVYIDDEQIDEKYIKYSYKYALTSIVNGYGTAEENPTPNFDIDIPLDTLNEGLHTIQINMVTADETTYLWSIIDEFTVSKEFFRIKLETLWDKMNITNQVHTLYGWVMTNSKEQTIRLMIDGQYQDNQFTRTQRADVNKYFNNTYPNENVTPGFSTDIDFSKLSLGMHQIALRVFDENNNKIGEEVIYVFVEKEITYEIGIYGKSGFEQIGDSRGTQLEYYRYGDGPNVFFATFSVHGYEDNWARDGQELTYIANKFYETLEVYHDKDYSLADKWTIYILPCVNPDGQNYGYTNNGPGRTTMYSTAPNNTGIDLNRCWKYSGFNANANSRNYAGTAPFQAYEAQYLRDFLQAHKSQNGQTILVDLHGWLQQLIGDRQVGMYYAVQFPENNGNALDRYGDGYLINWARTALANNNGKLAKTSLIELPDGSYNHQSVVKRRFAERYIQATLSMLNGIV